MSPAKAGEPTIHAFPRFQHRQAWMPGRSLCPGLSRVHGMTVVQRPCCRPAMLTRVTGFLWDRGRDRLWRQGIDLIGDDRGGQVGEGIEDGAMFGQSEGGEFLAMTDNGFDDVAPVEQSLVEERHR